MIINQSGGDPSSLRSVGMTALCAISNLFEISQTFRFTPSPAPKPSELESIETLAINQTPLRIAVIFRESEQLFERSEFCERWKSL